MVENAEFQLVGTVQWIGSHLDHRPAKGNGAGSDQNKEEFESSPG
jgi:hypothetical protein